MKGAMVAAVEKLDRACSMLPLRSSSTPRLLKDSAWWLLMDTAILKAW
jgi:hypothetical protein